LFGVAGRRWLAVQELPADEREMVEACLRGIDFLDAEVAAIDRALAELVLASAELRRLLTRRRPSRSCARSLARRQPWRPKLIPAPTDDAAELGAASDLRQIRAGRLRRRVPTARAIAGGVEGSPSAEPLRVERRHSRLEIAPTARRRRLSGATTASAARPRLLPPSPLIKEAQDANVKVP